MQTNAHWGSFIKDGGTLRRLLEERVLPFVQKPARYVGGEPGTVSPANVGTKASMLLAFPDAYEVGMSYLGFRILYDIINSHDGWRAERAYSPWSDMERAMRANGVPLYGLESFAPARSFDAIGITLQYELSYTNVLQLIDLSGVELKASDRAEQDPIIIAGGTCVLNPEPLASFIDCFFVGDGEEAVAEIMESLEERRAGRLSREQTIIKLSRIQGMYVPSLHDPHTCRIRRRVLADLERFPASGRHEIVPLMECVHDRAVVEVMRGCDRGCRFCQAGYATRPVRERRVESLREAGKAAAARGGYDEVSLLSLSTADYSGIERLVEELSPELASEGVALSLPSLRIDAFSIGLAEKVRAHRRTGLTFAPEAGTQRMRDIINKGVTEEDLLSAAEAAFKAGWEQLKLYFMIGLPFEQDSDVAGIADLCLKVLAKGKSMASDSKKASRVRLSVGISTLVPKPHTPFQWMGQEASEVIEQKKARLRGLLKRKDVALSFSDGFSSSLEAALCRGGREMGGVIRIAYEMGARFDGWGECIMPGFWMKAFEAQGLSLKDEASKAYAIGERLPWSHIETGVDEVYLASEYKKALSGAPTPDCRFEGCSSCGACYGSIGNLLRGSED